LTTSYIKFGKTRIRYDIIRSPSRKNTEIVVVSKKSVNVLAPANKHHRDIHDIVKSNSRWIFRKQLQLEEQHQKGLTYYDGSKLLYLGKKYALNVVKIENVLVSEKNGRIFTFHRGGFIVRVSDTHPKQIKALYEKWLEEHAPKVLKKKVQNYCKILGLNPSTLRIRIKSQRNRVGSLGRNLVLNFNRNILCLPLNIIEYVVLHELCHIRVPIHSAKFWQLVSTVMSDYKKRKEWLERNGQVIIS
jgi:predicted metal-dependent hydrolase